MPDLEEVKRQREEIKFELLKHFGSEQRLEEMTFEEKRRLLHWLFGGHDESGKPLGVYIDRQENDKWGYSVSGRQFHGINAIKGNNLRLSVGRRG
jgi:hypothetical protein